MNLLTYTAKSISKNVIYWFFTLLVFIAILCALVTLIHLCCKEVNCRIPRRTSEAQVDLEQQVVSEQSDIIYKERSDGSECYVCGKRETLMNNLIYRDSGQVVYVHNVCSPCGEDVARGIVRISI